MAEGLYVAVCVMSVLCSAGGAAIPGGHVVWRLFVETIPLAIVNIFISYMRTPTSGDSLTAAVGPREVRVRDGVHREYGVATQRGIRERAAAGCEREGINDFGLICVRRRATACKADETGTGRAFCVCTPRE